MNLEIIANVIFAIVIIRWVEIGVEKVLDYYYGKKRQKALDNLLAKFDEWSDNFDFNNDEPDCDDDCDVCNPAPVKPKKTVKKATPKKKTVKKAVAKKRK